MLNVDELNLEVGGGGGNRRKLPTMVNDKFSGLFELKSVSGE